ncbi:MAG: formate dehydrogenase [Alphaproteobacteria bacterium]|nr:formate dehydrogenase [Alphaproteobacteria bacterium]MBV8335196.1 formate dehydrogenase [Alphaproteobacteria bacterium]
MKAQDRTMVGRRNFFRLLGAGAAAGATAPLVREAAADSEPEDDKRKPRYRESDEVKTYYRVNRYPK